MAKGTNQKLKLVYLIKIMMEQTDDDHGFTMPEIIETLAAYEVTAERKSIYSDFETLRTKRSCVRKEKFWYVWR